MSETLMAIASTLKAARIDKGLTQRALGSKVGLPQSHISKIENGAVDLQASNLLELARALDLEIALVPRSLLPALQALQRGSERPNKKVAAHGMTDKSSERRPAYSLDEDETDG